MSYTNTINATRTPEHHIAGDVKTTNAQGTTITGRALKKVANFIGMDDVHEHQLASNGYLSTDLELELAARKLAFGETASLEAAESKRRMDDSYVTMTGKVLARKLADGIEAWANSGKHLSLSHDRIETRKFLQRVHEEMNEIERDEQDRRHEDNIGEALKKSLAAELISKVGTSFQSPHLNHAAPSRLEPFKQTLSRATQMATGAAGSVWGSMFQIGQFAARAAYFLGGKAAVKAQDLEEQVVTKAPGWYGEAATTASHVGEQASQLAQSALEAGQDLTEALFAPSTLSWSQIASMEEDERTLRSNEAGNDGNAQLNRFLLASFTSSLVKAHRENKKAAVGAPRFLGTNALEEMERARRIAQDKGNSTARLNAKRAAGAIMSHRRKMLCKQTAQVKAQERFEQAKSSPQSPRMQVQPALPASIPQAKLVQFDVPQTKRAVPQFASQRYKREPSAEVVQSHRAAM